MPHPAADTLADGLFAEALVTRICHDLAGPIGAFGNGLELLGEESDPAMQQQARELLNLSAHEGMARLQLYRIAFGQIKEGIPTGDVEETRQIARKFLSRGTITLDWPEGDKAGFGKEMPMKLRQVLGGMLIVTVGFLAFGGKLSVRHDASARRLTLTGTHKRLREDAVALADLSGTASADAPSSTPYNVIPRFLVFAARKSGMRLHCSLRAEGEEKILELSAEYPEGIC